VCVCVCVCVCVGTRYKAFPLQACGAPEGSGRLRLQDSMTLALEGGVCVYIYIWFSYINFIECKKWDSMVIGRCMVVERNN
jgi:hypothetical protein